MSLAVVCAAAITPAHNGKPNGVGTLTNDTDVIYGTWTNGCFRDATRKVSFGVPAGASVDLPLSRRYFISNLQERTTNMTRALVFLVAVGSLTCALEPSAVYAASADSQDSKGKVCRMEQQCHWENFKKICTWVKVCR
jgi:hypothetical protein